MEAKLGALRGESARIVAIRAQVAQLLARQTGARRLPPVLILGETGTGKGLVAQTIHQAGPRHAGPFVDVNCAAIPETLLEAELFGYERGAFTDARQAKAGLFQTAHGGTLFLDEIGLLPATLQSKLLTVLEDRAVRRLGSTRAEPIDVTLIAATSVDLKRAVADGRFRGDLYHRLAVITLELPPLHGRGADVLALADHFLARACADYGLSPRVLTPDARALLADYRWPGNVRELANVMERVVLLSDTDEITPAMLGLVANDAKQTTDTVGAVVTKDAGNSGSLDDALRARIEASLRDTGGNILRTAAALGISRNTLRARMYKYGLRRRDTPPAASRKVPEPPAVPHQPVARQPVPMQWEQRHLAFLRARLLGPSTADAARALEVIGEKVRSFGGRLEESSPMGVIAVFGLEPVDNAPSHAALAALAIQKAAAHARVAGGGSFEIAIALHCADLLVGRQEAAIQVGVDGKAATWSLLETLVADETSGPIVVSSPVVPFLARRFALELLRETTWLLLRREEPSVGWSATRFVGRTAELSTLREVTSRVEQRHGQIVGIVGEAGVGKSRLIHEVTRRLKGWLILSSGGVPYAKNTLYFPLVDLFKNFCHIQDSDTPAEVRDRVISSIPANAGNPELLLTPILDLLGMLPSTDAFRDVDPTQRRQRTHDAVKQVLLAASIAQPLCLIMEDLHWIDSATQELLDRFVNSMAAARVLLLVNYRPEYGHSWSSKSYYSQMRLDPLAAESTRELLDALFGDDPALELLKQRLVKRGNPFFLEETVRTLVETKALVGERGRYRLTQPVQEIQVPATVQAMLAARIDRLLPDDKRLLQVASVIGKDVPFALLQAIAESPDEARAGLGRLQAAEFLYETRLFPYLEYTFKHALTHEAVYAGLANDRRRALHASIVEAIERLQADRLDEHVERLAEHALRGELWDKAVSYLRRAGTRAVLRSAMVDAVGYFEHAIAVLASLAENRTRLEQAIDLRIDLRSALTSLAQFDRLLVVLREAEPLAERLGDPVCRGRLAIATAGCLWYTGFTAEGLRLAEHAFIIAETTDVLRLRASAGFALGIAQSTSGDYRRAIDTFLGTVRLLETEPNGGGHGFGTLTGIQSHSWLAWDLAQCGSFDEAEEHGHRGLTVAKEVDAAFTVILAYWGVGSSALLIGDYARALPFFERGLAIADEKSVMGIAPFLEWMLGNASLALGRAERGLTLLQDAVRHLEDAKIGLMKPLVTTDLGAACLHVGKVHEAETFAHRGLTLAQQQGERSHEAYALRLLGEIAAYRDPPDVETAENHYGQAQALATELGMHPLVAHCHLGLGKLYRRIGQGEQAYEHLTTSATMYREMDMRFWLEQAEAEMRGRPEWS
jgi:DNA-binding NtrC family response regulator/tetratricopeptide (TPR) repeat protein